mmetsp:Transcript_33009/g.46867  ORF Transcript_33009/g.46867 Transcript_33009/m.46867 type:complete len:178 (+) Transcript_33009:100-633(+)
MTMASVVWTTVFAFLMLELFVTFILIIPVPRKLRNWIAKKVFTFDLGQKINKVAIWITVALAFALAETIHSTQNIAHREHEHAAHDPGMTYEQERLFHDLDKQRKFRSQRNTYLAGFSLTLLFVIRRILQLLQEHVELEEEIQLLTAQTKPIEANEATNTDQIEMTNIKGKNEKKKD